MNELFLVCKIQPQDRADKLNGNGRFGVGAESIYSHEITHSSYHDATDWCVRNLRTAGTYVIINLNPAASPKCKLIELEEIPPVPEIKKLRIVDPK